MPTLTATSNNPKSQVRLDLDFSDIDALYAYVVRVDSATGATTRVRGHGTSQTINGLPYVPMQAGFKAVLYDTEAPLDTVSYYTATAPAVTMNANSAFSSGYVDPWYVTDPAIVMRITTNASGTNFLSFNTAGATLNPLIRAEDVPATAGATLTLTVTASSTVSQSITALISFRDASGAILSSPNTTATVLSSTTIVVTAVAPANTVSAQPALRMDGTPAASTVASFASVALTNAAGSATSGGVTVASLGSCWLKDPTRPSFNARVDFSFDPNPQCTPTEGIFWQSLDEDSRAANSVAFGVNNQAYPVVVSKTRSAPTSTLTLVSRTFADRDRLNALLSSGTPVLFQVPDEYGVPDRYMSVGTTAESRVLPDHRFPIRVLSLPHSVCAAPGGFMQGTVGARWQDTCNVYATWGAVNAAGLTWTQVLQGAAG
jgi:hypothetical protein